MFRLIRFLAPLLVLPWSALAEPLSTAKWLIDLGRDYPLSPQAALSDADAEITLLLMQAASRIDPQLSEAYLWQYDMLLSLGREAESRKILGEYVQRQSDDIAAYLNWIHQTAATMQTAEERAQFYESCLKRPQLAKTVLSDLHRRLGEFYWNRGDVRRAEDEIDLALQNDRLNLLARHLQDELEQAGDTPSRRIENLLAILNVNPAGSAAAEELANELVAIGWQLEAVRWYHHAVKIYELLPPGKPPPTLLLREASALLDAEQFEEAAALVKLIAEKNLEASLSDLVLAMIAAKRGDAAGARQQLIKAGQAGMSLALSALPVRNSAESQPTETQASEPDHERLLAEWQKPALTSQPVADIQAALNAFPSEVLNFPLKPEQYVSLELKTTSQEKNLSDPWWCTIQLKNTGEFPILFGPDAMLAPELLCSIETKGDRMRTSGPMIRIPLNRQLQLLPGETLEITQNILIGPIRSSMIGTPQAVHEVEVTAVLNPVRLMDAEGNELWAPGIGGLLAKPLQFRRLSEVPTADRIRAIISQSQQDNSAKRIIAMEALAMLLAEHQHLAAGRLNYSARRVDPEKLQAAVLARARDADMTVRARLMECMRWFVLDKSATQVGTGLLSDSHWLVRGLAARMLADHYRDKFTPVLKRMAEGDPDNWVRQFSAALLARMRAAASQPAGTTVISTSGGKAVDRATQSPLPPPSGTSPSPLLVLPDEPPPEPLEEFGPSK